MTKEDILTIQKGIAQKLEEQEGRQKEINYEDRQRMVNEMIDEEKFNQARNNIKIEDHIELIKVAYYQQNIQIFNSLVESGMYRSQYRRVEMPFIIDIDIKYSNSMYPNVKNGYEIIHQDLNEPYLKSQLNKLRNNSHL